MATGFNQPYPATTRRIPLGGKADRAKVLNTIGIGQSCQPYIKKRGELEFAASLLHRNAASEQSNISVEVSFGPSAILWH